MKIILALSSAIILLFSTSCKKDSTVTPYTCTSCVRTPEALAANDNSSKGIYKGVMIGSTGTIKFNIANNGNDITALMVIDGVNVSLTSTIAWVGGQPYVAPFTGTLNGAAVNITFSVASDGTNVEVTSSNIPGHPNAVFTLIKETSNALIEGFIGTYSTTEPETGIFNILVSKTNNIWGGISRKTGTTTSEEQTGTIVNNAIMSGTQQVGIIDGDNLSGSSLDGGGNTVNISGTRVL